MPNTTGIGTCDASHGWPGRILNKIAAAGLSLSSILLHAKYWLSVKAGGDSGVTGWWNAVCSKESGLNGP
jgi:hypothetical protein